MILFPAIDLKDGQCVRLVQGDMDRATIFNDSPTKQAKIFMETGFQWIHIVDLNGAFKGTPINQSCITEILCSITIPIQLGGGIRDMETAERWLKSGVKRIVLGTAALNNPEFTKEACKEFPGQVAVGIDTRNGLVAIEGWSKTSTVTDIDLVRRFEDAGVTAIIHTDIDRDGLMEGANIEATLNLASQTSIPLILSGGVSSMSDIENIKKYESEGIMGIISGRAIYDGRVDPTNALNFLCD